MKKISLVVCTLFAVTTFSAQGLAECHCGCQMQISENAEEHVISKIARSGSLLRIEDGSHWEIAPGCTQTALYWRASDTIIITPNSSYFSYFSSYPYSIRNLTTGTSLLARLSLGPVINGEYVTRQVSAVNKEEGQVLLTDGSKWLISHKDTVNFSKWMEGDYIIIGVNNESHYRNILINVATNKYVAAEAY